MMPGCRSVCNGKLSFLLLAALVFLNTLPILLFKEPDHLKTTTQTSEQPALSNIKTYFQYSLVRFNLGCLVTGFTDL